MYLNRLAKIGCYLFQCLKVANYLDRKGGSAAYEENIVLLSLRCSFILEL